MSVLRSRLLATSLLGGALIISAPVFAQPTGLPSQQAPTGQNPPTGPSADATTGADAEDTIVVTGSRIARPELDSATPVAVVGAEQIRQQGATNVQEVLARLPQVGIPGLSNTNSNFLTSGNGVSTVNLRNLGDARTLVLVNGRRFVAGIAGTSIVDVNDIPADFIDRVEVVTGGASAVYGSDAIAGVVNFVLKDNFEGLTARAQYGVTAQGDNPRYTASITGGTKFGGDRGSIIANFHLRQGHRAAVEPARDLGAGLQRRGLRAAVVQQLSGAGPLPVAEQRPSARAGRTCSPSTPTTASSRASRPATAITAKRRAASRRRSSATSATSSASSMSPTTSRRSSRARTSTPSRARRSSPTRSTRPTTSGP